MTEIVVNNEKNRDKNINFDGRGKFTKGNTISKGKRKRTQTDKLLAALKREGKKQGTDFWDAVAEAAFGNRDIMKAVVGKLVPNVSEITGLGGEPINITLHKIIYSEIKEEINEP